MQTRDRVTAILELTLAGAFWGFGFIAAVWTLRAMGPLAATGWRFAIAAGVGTLIILVRPELRRWVTWEQFRLAALPGFFISATLILQTWGLLYTTATKSAFLTTLYVLMVPFLEMMILRRRIPHLHYVYALLAMVGVALICDLPGELMGTTASSTDQLEAHRWNFGDLLTLFCAVAASLHIIWFGVIAKKIGSAFTFNNFQSVWAGAVPMVLALMYEPAPNLSWENNSWIGLLMLALGSTLIAFALQVRAQKKISPSVASLLFLLESPFSTLFAVYFLAESLRTVQWMGAALILLAAALSVIFTQESEEVEALEKTGQINLDSSGTDPSVTDQPRADQ
jgi:drug/metabolite transporter (DMT)-like permease